MAAIKRRDSGRRRGVRIATLIIAVLALVPVAYVFNGYRTSTEDGTRAVVVQRGGVDYMRPLTSLLAALVDVQGAAVRRAPVPSDTVHQAMEQISQVDKAWGDALEVEQRWSQLRDEIESTLARSVTGPNAMAAYAEPIGLTQSLLSRIGDTSMIARNPGLDAQYLIDTAVLGLPEVIVNAGELAGLAGSRTPTDPRVAVALDRISRAVQAIRVGPHSGADQAAAGTATMSLLAPLDEFTAAADGMVQTVSLPGITSGQAQADLDLALRRVREAALHLDEAVLGALKVLLDRRLIELDAQRRNTYIAGVLLITAAAVLLCLLWVGSEGSNRRHVARPLKPARSGLSHGPEHLGQEAAGQGLTSVGRSAHALQPREAR